MKIVCLHYKYKMITAILIGNMTIKTVCVEWMRIITGSNFISLFARNTRNKNVR